jgi:hypothetical protein
MKSVLHFGGGDEELLNVASFFITGQLANNFKDAAAIRMQSVLVMQLARWAACGMPSVSLTAQQASALALSDLSEEQAEELKTPWPCFCLYTENAFGAECCELIIAHRIVRVDGPRWNVQCIGQKTMTGSYFARTSDLASPRGLEHEGRAISGTLTTERARVLYLAGRCVVSTCAAITESKDLLSRQTKTVTKGVLFNKKPKKNPKRKKVIVLGEGESYTFGLPVTVDVREHVRDFIASDVKRVCKVRWIVRGHWRDQACGPGRQLRKRIWIEPHEKGKLDAPRMVRTHKLGENSENTSGPDQAGSSTPHDPT